MCYTVRFCKENNIQEIRYDVDSVDEARDSWKKSQYNDGANTIIDIKEPGFFDDEEEEIYGMPSRDVCSNSIGCPVISNNYIHLPEHLVKEIKYIVPPLIDGNWPLEGDKKLLKQYFGEIDRIIIKGDKPKGFDDNVYGTSNIISKDLAPGLSCHLKISKYSIYDSSNTPIQYFWMSWLMSHIPIFIVKSRDSISDLLKDDVCISDVLGVYIRKTMFNQPIIVIYYETIKKHAESNNIPVQDLFICTVIHELAHAVMDEGWEIENDIVSHTYKRLAKRKRNKEEAWANGLMLLYIKRFYGEDSKTFNNILSFTKNNQTTGYKQGEEYMQKYEEKKECWYDWYLKKCEKPVETSDAQQSK